MASSQTPLLVTLPCVLWFINGPYYFPQDPLAAVPKERARDLIIQVPLLNTSFTSDIYTGCRFLWNSLGSSLNLKKVCVFLEHSGPGKSFIGLYALSWNLSLSDWKVFRGTDFVIFLSQAIGIELKISLTKRNFFFFSQRAENQRKWLQCWKSFYFLCGRYLCSWDKPFQLAPTQTLWVLRLGSGMVKIVLGQIASSLQNLKVLDKAMVSCHILFFHMGNWPVIR